MNQLLSTDAVARDQRLAYWTDMICNVYVQLGCDPVRPDDIRPLRGQHPPALAAQPRCVGGQVGRAEGHAHERAHRALGDDYFLVSIQAQGRGVVRQDGRDAVLSAGDFALYDSTRPYELLFDEGSSRSCSSCPASACAASCATPRR
jgi:hypothetical protein